MNAPPPHNAGYPGGAGMPPRPPGGGHGPGGHGPGGYGHGHAPQHPPRTPGGFGGPPGGFGGPAGGFGGAPGGFGGPPGGYRPPPQKKSSVGLILALGCVGLLVLTVVVGVGASMLIRSAPPAPVPSATATADDSNDDSGDNPRSPSAASSNLELRALRFFKKSGVNNTIHVVGEIHNLSDRVVDSPRAKLVLLDANKKPVGEGSCAAWGVHDLAAGSKVPCATRITVTGTHKTYRVKFETSDAASIFKPADVRLTGINSTRAKSQFGAHKVTGKVTNHSTFPAKNVQVVVGLYDGDGKIVGARRTMVPGDAIAPGASTPFSLQIFNVAGKPAKSLTQVYGYDR